MKIAILLNDNRDAWRRYDLPKPIFGTAPEALLQGLEMLDGEIEAHVLSCTQKPLTAPEKIASNIFYHSLPVPKIGWLRSLYQGCIRATRRKLREIQPDIVHGQGTERDCSISAVFSGFPNVLTIHGNMRQVAKALGARPFSYFWLTARLESRAVHGTDGVICQTRYTREQVQSLARKTWLVPNAVDKACFEIQRNVEKEPILLCVADIISYKNQNQLIRSLDPIVSEHKFRLVFLGRVNQAAPYGPYGAEFLRLVRARPWCRHEGFADRQQLRQWLGRAGGLVLPTLEDNCPMVVLEAMAAGVPVVASRVGGVPDLVENGKTGLLFDPRNGDDMSAAIAKLLAEPELGRTLAAEAKRQAQERFHPLVVARRHVEIYREIMKDHPK
jgi:glycosyltransferase involved in cell wall biosynthesis